MCLQAPLGLCKFTIGVAGLPVGINGARVMLGLRGRWTARKCICPNETRSLSCAD